MTESLKESVGMYIGIPAKCLHLMSWPSPGLLDLQGRSWYHPCILSLVPSHPHSPLFLPHNQGGTPHWQLPTGQPSGHTLYRALRCLAGVPEGQVLQWDPLYRTSCQRLHCENLPYLIERMVKIIGVPSNSWTSMLAKDTYSNHYNCHTAIAALFGSTLIYLRGHPCLMDVQHKCAHPATYTSPGLVRNM